MLRVAVRYMKSGNWWEAGLVDHKPGKKPRHPTLFLSAVCRTKKDYEWFSQQVDKVVADSAKVAE